MVPARLALDHPAGWIPAVGAGTVRNGWALREAQAVEQPTAGDDPQPVCLQVDDDLGVGGRDPRARRMTVPQPRPERIGRQRQLLRGQIQRPGVDHGVVQPPLRAVAAERREHLLRGLDRREDPLGSSAVVPPGGCPCRRTRRPGLREPLVSRVGDDDGPVRELDLVAGSAMHDVGRCDNGGRFAVRSDQLVADRDLAHRRPPRRGREWRIEGQRLPHRRPGRHDDQVGGLETRGEAIQVGEAGGDAGDLAVVFVEAFDGFQGAGEDVAEGVVVLGDAALGDLVDEGLGDVDGAFGVLGGLEAELDDLGADVDEAAQDAGLLDDAGVVAGVGGGGDAGHQGVEERGAADVGQGAVAAQLLLDGDGVDGVAVAVQLEDRTEDRAVGRAVEVVLAQQLEDLGDGVLGEQHGAEDRFLGLDVMGWDALVGWGSAGPRAAVGDGADGHCRSPCSLLPS